MINVLLDLENCLDNILKEIDIIDFEMHEQEIKKYHNLKQAAEDLQEIIDCFIENNNLQTN